MEAQRLKSFEKTMNTEINLLRSDPISRYQLRHTLLLSSVPLVCGVLLLLLMTVFAKLNLYYLEANGLILDVQVRDAYYKQVELEMWGVVWYLVLQLGVTVIASYLVMRWATAPFRGAENTLRTAMERPDQLRPLSRWLSESPAFDRIIWQFALQVKGRNGAQGEMPPLPRVGTNILFFLKFCATFSALSVVTGYVMGIILSSVYERIVSLALQFVRKAGVMTHYFVAQQDILTDATALMTGLSLVVYFLMGWQISRYMSAMIFVFARGIKTESFPLTLRQPDIYRSLATVLNAAHSYRKTGNGA